MTDDTPTTLHAYLSYADAPAAIDWLVALGFAVTTRQDGEGGAVQHAELRLGDAVVMVASDDAAYTVAPLVGVSTGAGVYLCAADVDDLHRRAVAAGGTSVIAPEDTAWGSRRARVLDVGGREWSFGTYAPGRAW
ncbi:VOC family protein [Cellulomonas fimi]|uniref:VOC family protein n=1 Tax=Cellulomonas fimi TaxID=1708 RepID=UPI00234D668B|nr:VOC family protein [Cellulomonas fimi]MDC7121343.1 VOC family protein [Cellulomonas fimi]